MAETSAFLTVYERARILGLRALQIQQFDPRLDSIKSAKQELNENKLNTTIRRYISRDRFEDVRIDQLIHGRFDRRGETFLLSKLVPVQTQKSVRKTMDEFNQRIPTTSRVSKFLPADTRSAENL
jgi:DNA-directed RNA polymerase subunit K/omega